MPRKEEPRLVVRFSDAGYAAVEAVAASANVAVGALVRECAERYAATVAREVLAGNIVLRRQKIETAEAATAGQVVRASSLARGEGDAGWSRQERVNAMTARARAGKPAPKRRAS